MKIVFYDVATPIPYTETTLYERGLGGTEATIIRVARALAAYHEIYIAQHCRDILTEHESVNVNYVSLTTANRLNPDIVILLREYEWIDKVGQIFPYAKLYFWIHNLPPRDFYKVKAVLLQYQYTIIAVSYFHKQTIINRLNPKWYQQLNFAARKSVRQQVKIVVVYNPIDNDLIPDQTVHNPNQLLFMSSPHKGLAQCLRIFNRLLQTIPQLELLICNPGNWNSRINIPNAARVLGTIPHREVITYLRTSLCVFYPQTKRAETFGLVYAEANAVGTPVLAHDIGSAKEVLSDSQQLVNGKNFKAIQAKILAWRKQRPILQAKSLFRLQHIVQDWLQILV